MKRMLAVVMAVMMLVVGMSAAGVAGSAETEQYRESLRLLYKLYTLNPDLFTDTFVVDMYLTLMLYMNSSTRDVAYSLDSIKDETSGKIIKSMTSREADLSRIMSEAYMSWSDGGMTIDQLVEVFRVVMDDALKEDK